MILSGSAGRSMPLVESTKGNRLSSTDGTNLYLGACWGGGALRMNQRRDSRWRGYELRANRARLSLGPCMPCT